MQSCQQTDDPDAMPSPSPPSPLETTAKTFVPGKEGQSSQVALCVLQLQQALPAARVVYCSATGTVVGGRLASWEDTTPSFTPVQPSVAPFGKHLSLPTRARNPQV